ncbi:sodium channel subunit beta-2-like isoform X2 [Eublepharis macularius]|uniref:Sodium channel subunit beta-2-like isoform X2 n=1 Tax=Eublepharis macularius TaxID=481883 RepID=A0AA97KEI5_EUBMA|nr:sodium channel subunit beta-2-like isoform X2 [Eublepharis macularius]
MRPGRPRLALPALALLGALLARAPSGLAMEVTAPATVNALNGSSAHFPCTFNSCYRVTEKQFSLNWTYQECGNCTEVMLEDEGLYNCYVLNPPDRHKGHAKINLKVVTEVPPERDSTVAVIVGASVGGFLAMVILALVVVKCLRRRKQQKLNTDDQKTEEEGKTDGEGNPEEGPK